MPKLSDAYLFFNLHFLYPLCTIGPWRNSSSASDQAASVDSLSVTSRLQQRREEERKLSEETLRRSRIEELLYQQDMLKREMMDAKNRLMVPAGNWSYEREFDFLFSWW